MHTNSLPQCCRLHLKKDFKFIFASGNKLQRAGLVLWWVKNVDSLSGVRFAVVVSKKLGSAVVRNRCKRFLREAFRQYKHNFLSGTMIIVSPRDEKKLSSVHVAKEALMTLCGEAALLNSSSANL